MCATFTQQICSFSGSLKNFHIIGLTVFCKYISQLLYSMQVADKSNWAMPIGVFHLVSWISLFCWGLILFACPVRSALRQAGMINYRHNGGMTCWVYCQSSMLHVLAHFKLFIYFFFCCTILNKLAVAAWQLWFALHVRMHVATPTPHTPTGTQRIVIL